MKSSYDDQQSICIVLILLFCFLGSYSFLETFSRSCFFLYFDQISRYLNGAVLWIYLYSILILLLLLCGHFILLIYLFLFPRFLFFFLSAFLPYKLICVLNFFDLLIFCLKKICNHRCEC